jgi:hypothetical protein
MPRARKDSATVIIDVPGYVCRTAELGDFTDTFETFSEDGDGAPAFKGLPDDSCPCPHWGLVASGRLTLRYRDHEETFEADEIYYAPPGHLPAVIAGTEIISFSPTEELKETFAMMAKNMATARPPRSESQD